MSKLTLFAPLAGWSTPLEEAPDAVFAGRMLGDGLAIDSDVSAIFGEILLTRRRGVGVKFNAMRKSFRNGLRAGEGDVKEQLCAGTRGEIGG